MKQNSGFIFIEVLAIFFCIAFLLAALLKNCGSSILLLQKSNKLQSAWQYVQSEQADADKNWQRREIIRSFGSLKIREIQVIQNEKIISNLVSVEK